MTPRRQGLGTIFQDLNDRIDLGLIVVGIFTSMPTP